ncbi:MAG: cadherin repeat domain-containing protein, partial [Pirellulales bacterium]|nr:cadherin repeat domain-containing protein [Pirellulales bacterium]
QGETFTYLLQNDPTGKFEIAGNTLKLKAGESLDREATPTVDLLLRTTDSGGLFFDKAFTIAVNDVPETLVVGVGDWTAAGLSMELGADGKLHVYRTGGTEDAVPPHHPAMVLGIDVTGNGLADVMAAVSMGAGIPELSLKSATLILDHDGALSPGVNVTVDGGALNYNGHAAAIGDLLVKNDGQVIAAAIDNSATTVALGTLTASSLVSDSLTIGLPAPAAAGASAGLSGSAIEGAATSLPSAATAGLPGSASALGNTSLSRSENRRDEQAIRDTHPKIQSFAAHDNPRIRQLALRSLAREWRQDFSAHRVDAELLSVMHPRRSGQLSEKAVDELWARP